MVGVDGSGDGKDLHHGALVQLADQLPALGLAEVHAIVGNLAGGAGVGTGVASGGTALVTGGRVTLALGGGGVVLGGGFTFTGVILFLQGAALLILGGFLLRQKGKVIPMDVADVGTVALGGGMLRLHVVPGDLAAGLYVQNFADVSRIQPEPIVRGSIGLFAEEHLIRRDLAIGARGLGAAVEPLGQDGQRHQQCQRQRHQSFTHVLHLWFTSVSFAVWIDLTYSGTYILLQNYYNVKNFAFIFYLFYICSIFRPQHAANPYISAKSKAPKPLFPAPGRKTFL